ncbi:GNAT family N-acetyltransferase [Chloroflexota bacterium]
MIRLEKAHIKPLSLMLTRAFKDDQADIFPDPVERRMKAPYVHEIFLRCSLPHIYAFITSPRLEGVIVWRHSDIQIGISWWRIITSGAIWLALKIGYKALRKIMVFDQYMEGKRKELAPAKHLYLGMLAVDPQYQGKRYASQLLDELISKMDRECLPCYLETEGDKNVSVYQHFGFRVIDEYIVPDTKDKMIAMLRRPKELLR